MKKSVNKFVYALAFFLVTASFILIWTVSQVGYAEIETQLFTKEIDLSEEILAVDFNI